MKAFAEHYGLSKILENQIKFGSFAESSQKFRHLQEYLNILRETINYFIGNSSNSHLTMAQRVESSNLPKDRFNRELAAVMLVTLHKPSPTSVNDK